MSGAGEVCLRVRVYVHMCVHARACGRGQQCIGQARSEIHSWSQECMSMCSPNTHLLTGWSSPIHTHTCTHARACTKPRTLSHKLHPRPHPCTPHAYESVISKNVGTELCQMGG